MPYSSQNSPTANGCLFLVVGLVLLIVSTVSGCNDLRYKVTGQRTNAKVTYTWVSPSKSGSHGNSYYDFTFNGKRYSGKGGAHSTGDEIPIEFISSNPTMNREMGGGAGAWALLGVAARVGLLAAGGFLLKKNDDLLGG